MSNQYPPPDGPGPEPDDQHGSDRPSPPPPPPAATGPQWNPQSAGTPPPGSGGEPSYGQPGYGQPDSGQSPYGQSPDGQSPYGESPEGQAPYGQAPSYGPAPSYQPQGGGHAGGYAGPPKTSPLAIVSLVLGIVGFVFCTWFVLSLGAVVTGFIARKQINASQGALKGAGMATSGLVLGVVSIILALLSWVLVLSGTFDPADLQTP